MMQDKDGGKATVSVAAELCDVALNQITFRSGCRTSEFPLRRGNLFSQKSAIQALQDIWKENFSRSFQAVQARA